MVQNVMKIFDSILTVLSDRNVVLTSPHSKEGCFAILKKEVGATKAVRGIITMDYISIYMNFYTKNPFRRILRAHTENRPSGTIINGKLCISSFTKIIYLLLIGSLLIICTMVTIIILIAAIKYGNCPRGESLLRIISPFFCLSFCLNLAKIGFNNAKNDDELLMQFLMLQLKATYQDDGSKIAET